MDSIFLQCKFCSESNSLYISLIGPTIGAIATVLTFIFGIHYERRKQKEIEKKRIHKISVFIKTSLELISEGITQQSNYLLEFGHKLKKRSFNDKNLEVTSKFSFENINSIPNIDIYKVFDLNCSEELEKYHVFQANFTFLNLYRNKLVEYITDFNKIYCDIQKRFGEDILAFTNIYDSYVPSIEPFKNSEREDVMFFWNSRIIEWQQVDETSIDNYRTDPYIVYDKIIKPVISHIRKNKYEINVIDILRAANKCRYHIKNFDHQRISLRKTLILDARKLLKIRNQLMSIKECL